MKALKLLLVPCWIVIGLATIGAVSYIGLLFFGSQVEHANVSFTVSPNGDRILFSSAAGQLYWLDLASKKVERLRGWTRQGGVPVFSPNGKTVAFGAPQPDGKGSSIFLMDVANGKVRQLTTEGNVADGSPAFSPDGMTVAFPRAYRYRQYSMGGWVWGDFDLCTIGVNGSGFKRLTRKKYYGMGPVAFGNRGKMLYSAMGHGADLDAAVYEVDRTGKGAPRLLMPKPASTRNMGAWASDLTVSKDGKKIAFISDRASSFQYDIFVANADGTKARSLGATKISRYNQNPAFMPIGNSLLFLAGTEWNAGSRPIFSLWEIDLKGKARRIADSGLFTDPENWNPKQ